jgi:hypothetical protein
MQNFGRQIISLFQCNHLIKIIIPLPVLSKLDFCRRKVAAVRILLTSWCRHQERSKFSVKPVDSL